MNEVLDYEVLKLPQGSIKGAKRETLYGELYYSFEGIPYAKPPVGDLRFKAPQPAESWSDTLDCTMSRSKPQQNNVMEQKIEGSEDCLYLNVYAKTIHSSKPLPVMVWIYGGAYFMGEATRELYSPDYFMHEDIILVTFNYRLCSLGFLSLKDPKLGVLGNAGLKDQILALKWVKNYISNFNGDAENITVFGESVGGTSTHFMMLTEQTRNLFQRGILMSGCALNMWADMPQIDMAYRLAKYHGYTGENIDKDVLAYLQTLPATKLIQHDLLNDEERRDGYLFAFGPIVEPYVSADCVIPKSPFQMLKTAWGNTIPMMIGATSEEGLMMYTMLKFLPQTINAFKDDLQCLLPVEVRKNHNEIENQALSEKLKELHFGDKMLDKKCLMEFVHFYTLSIFWHAAHRTVLARLNYASKAPTYLYRFNFDSPKFNLSRNVLCAGDPIRGVAHADDVGYLFYNKKSWKLSKDTVEFKTIQRMVSLWTSFAQNGNPNCEAIKPTEWKPLNLDNPYLALNISDDVQFMEIPEKQELDVWHKLYKTEDLY